MLLPVVAGLLQRVTTEPAWHRRQRSGRQAARLTAQSVAKAARLLENHHGRAMPQQAKHVVASFNAQPYKSYAEVAAEGVSGWGTQKWPHSKVWSWSQRPRRSWTPCPAACGGWSFDDRGFTHCARCGAAYSEQPCAGPAPIEIDEALLAKLRDDDPVKETLGRVIASGAGTVVSAARKPPSTPFADAQAKLKTATCELVKSQNQLNHQRT